MVYVHVRDASIKESEILEGYKAPISEEEFRVWWGWGGFEITFKESSTKKPKILKDFYYVKKEKVMFELDTRTFSGNKVLLHFLLEQWTRRDLIVPMMLSDEVPTAASNFPPVNSSSSSSNIPHPVTLATAADSSKAPGEECEKDFDDILTEIANRINERTEIDRLGGKLGFEPEERQRYIGVNQRDGDYMGTLNMLRKWRKGTTKSRAREQLRKALKDAKLTHLADNYLGGVNLT
ncbi:uncharacterized protein LOC121406104 [Lytechinus variegatus]|uniref:uncharacterized protein LOC121406104 n=1 Tax=Lytechinus variegatus TaxID=7654 RepID=UPI001BB14425|nr:uncharacterized protein LOC121406104 [Lytechinus variegatus]